MELRLRYRNSLVRLAASLAIALALLAAIVGHVFVSTNYINKLHEYKLAHVTARDEALIDFHHEFLMFGQIVRDFFYLYFLESQMDDLGHYVDNAFFSYKRLVEISDVFIVSIYDDPLYINTNQMQKSKARLL